MGAQTLRRRQRASDERGAASLELVLIAPVLVVLLLLLAQWAIREQGQRAVSAAAREGAAAAAAWQARPDDGHESADSTLESSGADLEGVAVMVERQPNDATVTVTASVPSLIPGVDLTVTSTQSAPLEVFVP